MKGVKTNFEPAGESRRIEAEAFVELLLSVRIGNFPKPKGVKTILYPKKIVGDYCAIASIAHNEPYHCKAKLS